MKLGRIIVLMTVFGSVLFGDEPKADTNMFRVPLPTEQATPFTVPCSPEDSVLIVLPYAVTGWSGRGFSPQGVANTEANAGTAGDFTVFPGDLRGYKQFTISALVDRSSRTMHIFMEGGKILSIECVVAPSRDMAFRGVTFIDTNATKQAVAEAVEVARDRANTIERSEEPPVSRYQEPSPESQVGLKNFMKALLAMNEERAAKMVGANPALQLVRLRDVTDSGDYKITMRFALRDEITDTLGLCVTVKNETHGRLIFDNASWILRSGDRVYPVPTAEFVGELEPGASAAAFLVLARDAHGAPTRILPDGNYRVGLDLKGKVNTKPVSLNSIHVE